METTNTGTDGNSTPSPKKTSVNRLNKLSESLKISPGETVKRRLGIWPQISDEEYKKLQETEPTIYGKFSDRVKWLVMKRHYGPISPDEKEELKSYDKRFEGF